MAYATPADLYALAGQQRIRDLLFDGPEDLDSLVADQMEAAAMTIDLHIGRQCDVPVDIESEDISAEFKAWLKRCNVAICWHNLGLGSASTNGRVQDEYDRVMKQLGKILAAEAWVPMGTGALKTRRRLEMAFSDRPRSFPTSLFRTQRATAGEP